MPQQEHIERIKYYYIEKVLDKCTQFSILLSPTFFSEGGK